MKRKGRKPSSCADCSKRRKKCDPAHLLGEEHRGEEASKGEEGEAEWEEDALAPFRRVALPGEHLGAGIRDRAIGRRLRALGRTTATLRSLPQVRYLQCMFQMRV